MQDMLWPLRGVLIFLQHPSWWIQPMLGMLLGLLALIGIGISTAWFLWPGEAQSGWMFWWWVLFAIGIGCAVVVVAWVLLLPVLVSFLLEGLAKKTLQAIRDGRVKIPTLGGLDGSGSAQSLSVPPSELAIVPGFFASLRVLSGTLFPRLGWLAASFLSGVIIPPAGVVVSGLGMGHIACIDACDIAMSLYGLNGEQRLNALRNHRIELRQASLTAGLMNLGLVATILGWLVWLPGVVVGAVVRTASWTEVQPQPSSSETTSTT